MLWFYAIRFYTHLITGQKISNIQSQKNHDLDS